MWDTALRITRKKMKDNIALIQNDVEEADNFLNKYFPNEEMKTTKIYNRGIKDDRIDKPFTSPFTMEEFDSFMNTRYKGLAKQRRSRFGVLASGQPFTLHAYYDPRA
jgi:hypothetical protein